MTDKEANERLVKAMLAVAPSKLIDFHDALVFFNELVKRLREADTAESTDNDTH